MRKTRAALKLWLTHSLPDELWPEILSRLPVKVLFRFRCVCKSWKLFIDDPHFARLHLTNFNKCHESNLFFVQRTSSSKCVVKNYKTLKTIFSLGYLQSDVDSRNVLRTTPARSGVVKKWSIVSSIDVLFMLQSSRRSKLMLWNPSIRKTLILPQLPDLPLNTRYVEFGLGFDPVIKDYKFVRFGLKPINGVQFAAIYTLGTNSWKTVEFQGECLRFIFDHGKRSISLNGVVYALARNKSLELVSYDLRSELLASFDLPVTNEQMYHQALTLVDDGCSLALVNLCESNISIWHLKGDDIKSWSWIQCNVFPRPASFNPWLMNFLWLKKNSEMLLKCGVL